MHSLSTGNLSDVTFLSFQAHWKCAAKNRHRPSRTCSSNSSLPPKQHLVLKVHVSVLRATLPPPSKVCIKALPAMGQKNLPPPVSQHEVTFGELMLKFLWHNSLSNRAASHLGSNGSVIVHVNLCPQVVALLSNERDWWNGHFFRKLFRLL